MYVAPTGFPSTVMDTTTPDTAMVTWNTIECIDRNGIITDYVVQFQEQESEADVDGGVVNGRTYTVSGLTPATRYTFRVAGVTSGGTGPFSPARVVTTMEARTLTITCRIMLLLAAGIHTGGAFRTHCKVVLKHKQQLLQLKTPRIFQRRILAAKRHCFQLGGGGGSWFHPLFEKSCEPCN